MRHGKNSKQLSRTRTHFVALMRNLLKSLTQHGLIITSSTKAKLLKRFIDKIATKCVRQKERFNSLRVAIASLGNSKEMGTLLLQRIEKSNEQNIKSGYISNKRFDISKNGVSRSIVKWTYLKDKVAS